MEDAIVKNRYFQEMQRIGIKYQKGIFLEEDMNCSRIDIRPPFTEGQSFAFKFWAIAERYHATDIIVDDLPRKEEIQEMLETFTKAGIQIIVVTQDSVLNALCQYGCDVLCDAKVYRRETELYYGRLEIIKGVRLKING